MPKGKGSGYEREICKLLSRWWTNGERDDIFWRATQSGGRATQRAKTGRKTAGSYGDIAAIDPSGGPLLEIMTIELKRGRSHGCISDVLDTNSKARVRKFEESLQQAITSHKQAGSLGWMLIYRRDCKVSMACLDWNIAYYVSEWKKASPRAQFILKLEGKRVRFITVPLSHLIKVMSPDLIKELARDKRERRL